MASRTHADLHLLVHSASIHTAVQRPNHSIRTTTTITTATTRTKHPCAAQAMPCDRIDDIIITISQQKELPTTSSLERASVHHAYPPLAWRHDMARREERCAPSATLVPVCDPHAHVAADEPCSLAGPSNDGFHGRRAGRPALFASSIPLLSVE